MLRKRRILNLILSGLILLYLVSGITEGLNVYDEGISVYNAVRINRGDIPYRDFWTIYAPGQFYLTAALFRLFGPSLITERIMTRFMQWALIILIYFMSGKLMTKKYQVSTGLMSAVWIESFRYYGSPVPSALTAAMMSSIMFYGFIEEKNNSARIFAAGVLCGLTTWFRQDIGFYTFLSAMAALFFSGCRKSGQKTKTAVPVQALVYAAGTAAIISMPLIFFLMRVPIRELVNSLIVFPVTVFPDYRSLPFPSPVPNTAGLSFQRGAITMLLADTALRISFYFPLIVFAVTALYLIKNGKKRKQKDKNYIMTFYLCALGITYFNQARVRTALCHLLPAMAPAVILFNMLLQRLSYSMKASGHRIKKSVLFGAAATLMLPVFLLPLSEKMLQWFKKDNGPRIMIDQNRGQHIYLLPGQAYPLQKAINFMKQKVPPNKKIYAGTSRHDRITVNDVMFYFLSERESAVKYHELHPGIATEPQVQKEIIRDLERHNVNYLVLWSGAENIIEPNKSGESNGSGILDDYITEVYEQIERYPPYTIHKRIRD